MTTIRSGFDVKNIADLQAGSHFYSVYRDDGQDIDHARKSWIYYDFKDWGVVPTHSAVCCRDDDPGSGHPESWVVDGRAALDCQEIDHEDDNHGLDGRRLARTFAVPGGVIYECVRPVNIGRNDRRNDCFAVEAWGIFGTLLESSYKPPNVSLPDDG
jgi:hypothetical protein